MPKKSTALLLTTIFAIPILLSSVSPAWAATPTPSPSTRPTTTAQATLNPSPTASSSTTQNLKARIEKIVEEKRDQVKGVLSELSESKRAFIAEVQRVSAESITVKNPKGTFILPLDNQLTLTKANKVISVDDVAVGDWALVIGNSQNSEFKAENIIISPTSLRPQPKLITLGSISSINRARTQLTLAPRSGEGEVTLDLMRNTTYQDLNGAPIKKEDLTEDMQCLVVATIDGDKRQATTIRVLTEIE